MRGRRSSRDALLAAAIALAAYFTARSPRGVPALAPGLGPTSRPARPPTMEKLAAVQEEWRDAPAEPPDTLGEEEGASSRAHGLIPRALGATHPGADHAATPRELRTSPHRGPHAGSGAGGGEFRVGSGRAETSAPTSFHSMDHRKGLPSAADEKTASRLGASTPSHSPGPNIRTGFDSARRPAENGVSAGVVDLRRRRTRASSLFEPPRLTRRSARGAAARAPRFRPPRLSRLLGTKPLRPPTSGLRPPPDLASLPMKQPLRDAEGALLPPPAQKLGAIEGVAPEGLPSHRRRAAHWDDGFWHEQHARGLVREGGWVWLDKAGGRWWGLVDKTPLLRHQGMWWLQEQGVWLVLHQGEPWAWRRYQDWGAEGLFHPGTGTEIVYSSDLSRAAVVTPGEGAVVYDAMSGAEIGRIPEESMPARRRPRAPKSLSLP